MILIYNFKEILNGFLVSTELRKHQWNFGTGCVSTAVSGSPNFPRVFQQGNKAFHFVYEGKRQFFFFRFHVITMNEFKPIAVRILSCLLQQ